MLCLDLGLFTLLAGICGIRAATDVERIVPYLLLSCALFLYKAAITVAALSRGQALPSGVEPCLSRTSWFLCHCSEQKHKTRLLRLSTSLET